MVSDRQVEAMPDGRRLVLARQVVQGDPQVVGAAEDGRRFAEIRGGNIYGPP